MKNLLLWFLQRFPPVTFVTALLLSLLPAALFRDVQNPLGVGFVLALTVAVWSQLLILRVLDEHKDYEQDCRSHPDRVLQRGLVTLQQLRGVGGLAFVSNLFLTLVTAKTSQVQIGVALVSWGLMQVWTFLMLKEFFVPSFLRKRLWLYSISHLFVLPILVFWLVTLVTPRFWERIDVLLVLLALVLTNGCIYEIQRKFKNTDEEPLKHNSFLQSYGANTSIYVLQTLHVISFFAFIYIAYNYKLFSAASLVVAVFGVGTFVCNQRLFAQSDKKNRKTSEGVSALFVAAEYLALSVSVLMGFYTL